MSKLSDKNLIYNVYVGFCRIKYYMQCLSNSEFEEDIKTRDAVKYNLINIGMWSNRLSTDFTVKYSDFPFLITMLHMNGFFDEEELWELIKNKENGIMQYFDKVEKIFAAENPDEAKEFQIRNSPNRIRDNVPLSTNYKYPIHSKSSLWTVKKK